MTQDEIIEMAIQAHRDLVTEYYVGHHGQIDAWTMLLLERFAKLVEEKSIQPYLPYKEKIEAMERAYDAHFKKARGQA